LELVQCGHRHFAVMCGTSPTYEIFRAEAVPK
jgi:hypothetical protein